MQAQTFSDMPDTMPDTIADTMAGGASFAIPLFLAEYAHRSAHDLALACAEVHVAGRETTLERVRGRLASVTERLYALASIQRLLQPPRASVMDLGLALDELCQHQAMARFTGQGVFVQLRADATAIDARRGWAVLMIVSELLTNAARHAFHAPGGTVRIDMLRQEDQILCIVSDNGVGLGKPPHPAGSGMAIMANLARSAGIAMDNLPCQSGTMVALRVPMTQEG